MLADFPCEHGNPWVFTGSAASVEQEPQGSDITRTVGEIRKIEPSDDLKRSRARLENPGESASLDERADDSERARILAKARNELGFPAFG